jgi:hypothetical protein
MELLNRFLLDTGLLLSLIISTIIVNIAFLFLFKGNFSLRSLSFGIFGNSSSYIISPSLILIFIVLFSFLPLLSFFCTKLFYLLGFLFDLIDISLILIAVFVFMFFFMQCDEILIDISKIKNLKKPDDYNSRVWERIDSSLTPTIINTSLVAMGIFTTCYSYFNLK